MAPLPPDGHEPISALVVVIPEAEPVVADLRANLDPAAEVGVPAHVTVLYPFMQVGQLDGTQRQRLAETFRGERPFDYRFDAVKRFGETTVYLEPVPSEAFAHLTRLVAERWPDYPPYEGMHDEVIPHLTVGDRLGPGMAAKVGDEAWARLRRHGAITGRATSVTLIVEDADGQWSAAEAFPLRGEP